MHRAFLLLLGVATFAFVPSGQQDQLRMERASAGDLELGGDLRGVPAGATRYVRYEDLLRMPLESYTVNDDSNLPKGTRIEGVSLAALERELGDASQQGTRGRMVVAICYDRYRTNYPSDYVAEHHPVLVLRINGKERESWPPSEHGGVMGPYMISHPFFKPAFQVLSHRDEPQVPFGVTRLELRNEAQVFGAIEPPGKWAEGSAVAQGYTIARQDCFRCHNMGAEGGTLAGQSWLRLAQDAQEDGGRFAQRIRNPKAVDPQAKMQAHPEYDDATLHALTAYFRTFSAGAATR